MKIVAVALSISVITACTPSMIERGRYEAQGRPEDVSFCKYEAVKAGQANYTTRSAVGQGMEDYERQSQVFIACMRYRQGQ
jgi:hypothetical protein